MQERRKRKKKASKIIFILLVILTLTLSLILVLKLSHPFSENKTEASVTKISKSKKESETTTSDQISSESPDSADLPIDWIKQETPINIPILMYHAIHEMAPEEISNANLIVDPTTFESHIQKLSEEGYYFLTPEEAYQVLSENALPNGNNKVIWLTFDDSLWDFYDHAFPILKKYQAKATNNVITGSVNNPGSLTLDQMIEMKEASMSFQGHTVNHPDLEMSDLNSQNNELEISKEYLDSELNQETIAVAYPAGRYSNDTLQITQSLNYKLGVTTNEGLASAVDGLLSLNRVRILPSTTAESLLNQIQ